MLKLFFKKNFYYIIMFICVLGIGSMIITAILSNNADLDTGIIDAPVDVVPPLEDEIPTAPDISEPSEDIIIPPLIDDPVIFAMPTSNTEIVRDYSATSPVKWETLGHFAIHSGIDFIGEFNDPVHAVLDGIVTKISYDILNGHMVVIDHGNDMFTLYGSLSEPLVELGQTVTAGDIIGGLSNSAASELELGAHVHFAVILDTKYVDPVLYLPIGDK
jgi:murein DD-endopeptidase MepM/ murein hydrolase activator NlpD